jgi:hypothetical protein
MILLFHAQPVTFVVKPERYLSRHPRGINSSSNAGLLREWNLEVAVSARRLILPVVFLGVLIVVSLAWRPLPSRRQLPDASALDISKLPVVFAAHTFDPAAPPADMPPLAPKEIAVCDSDFLSSAIVRGETRRTDATHAILTITHVKVTLQLKINLWLPTEAPQNLVDHEEGHRQISEHTYQTAEKLAERIAAAYIGKQIEITGTDLDDESRKMLHQLATEITDQYNKELNPNPPQLLYDSITDHAKNGVLARDAVDHVIKNAAIESPGSPASPGN